MKYNLRNIMKRAWQLKKDWHCRALSFGQCLKRAWAEAKAALQNSLVSTVFDNGMEITVDGYTRTLNRWTKGEHDRVYINCGRKSEGFVDIKTGFVWLKEKNSAYANKMAEKVLAMEF